MGLWPKETAGARVVDLGPQTGLSLSPHMVLGWELPWEQGCPLGLTECLQAPCRPGISGLLSAWVLLLPPFF